MQYTQIEIQVTFKTVKHWKITNLKKKLIAKIRKNSWYSRIYKICKICILDLWL